MAFESTVTEYDMDLDDRQFVQGFHGETQDIEPDLAVDGLSESVLSRLFGLFGVGSK